MDITGKRIIVTGGASGIGASALRALVGAGAHVASLDIADDKGNQIVDTARSAGQGRAKYFHCDVSQREEVTGAFAAATAWLGGLDSLVHIAGLEIQDAAESISDAHWDRMLDVNARGTFLTNQAAFQHLRAGGGHIINFSSAAGVQGMPGAGGYATAKAAVLGWTRTAAREWGKYNITVNAMAPGMWTPMYDNHRSQMTAEELAAHDALMAGLVPIGGKLGNPDTDLAPVLLFLVSDGARFITGQTLAVDGGMMI